MIVKRGIFLCMDLMLRKERVNCLSEADYLKELPYEFW
jgi:hypothetical protein